MIVSLYKNFSVSQISLLLLQALFWMPQIILLARGAVLIGVSWLEGTNDSLGGAEAPLVLAWSI